MNEGLNLDGKDIAKIVGGIIKGIATKNIKASTVKNLLKGLKQSGDVGKLYDSYPDTFDGFAEWKKQADALWASIGSLADTCDPEILKKLGITK